MQPFNQQLPFRYFDSDMAKKRPLVVSFRRIQKMTPNNMETCGSVSICDIHRIDSKLRDNDAMTMKFMTKYCANPSKMTMPKRSCCNQSQSCRNCSFNDKRKSQLDSLFDENVCDSHHLDKGVFPKEKFYGNAKILLTLNDDILRKAIIDCDTHAEHAGIKHQYAHRNSVSTHHLSNDKARNKNRTSFKANVGHNKHQTIASTATDKEMIDGYRKSQRGFEVRNDPLLGMEYEYNQQLYKAMLANKYHQPMKERFGYETPQKLSKSIKKSSSVPTVYPFTKLSTFIERTEDSKASEGIQKSVSMLSVNGK